MLSGRQLRKLFHEFNERYFEGRLPDYRIRVVPYINRLGKSGHTDQKRKLIRILIGLSDEDAKSTLLHEMAHAATNEDHATAWKKEMIRLRKQEAPLVSSEFQNFSLWSGRSVSQKHFRGGVQDVLGKEPNATLHQAIRDFIHNDGGAESVAGFLRRYPWARRAFRVIKKEHAAYLKDDVFARKLLARHSLQ